MKQEECHQILELNVQSLCITPYVQYENKILMKLLASFQQDIKDAIAQQREEGVKTVQFTAEELDSGVRHRTLPLAMLEPNKGHYNRTKLALTDMAEKKLWIPFNNKGILDYVRTPPLFSRRLRDSPWAHPGESPLLHRHAPLLPEQSIGLPSHQPNHATQLPT